MDTQWLKFIPGTKWVLLIIFVYAMLLDTANNDWLYLGIIMLHLETAVWQGKYLQLRNMLSKVLLKK